MTPPTKTAVTLRGAWIGCALLIGTALPTSMLAQAGGSAREKAPATWSIPWLQGTTLSKRTIVEKRFGRLQRNEIWDDRPGGDIQHLVTYILEHMDYTRSPWKEQPSLVPDLRSMHAYAHFYKARLVGRALFFNPPSDESAGEEKRREILAEIQEAVKLGYTNHKELEGARELFPVQRDPSFTQLVAELGKKAEQGLQEGYRKHVDEAFARYAKGESAGTWKPTLATIDPTPEPFWPQKAAPSAVVVCRVHHDGFAKFLGTLTKISNEFAGSVDFGVAFYQVRGDDVTRRLQTRRWREDLDIQLPCAIIDRPQYLELRSLLRSKFQSGQQQEAEALKTTGKKPGPTASYEIFQPAIVFLDAEGKPVFQTNGVLRDWQLRYVVERFLAAVTPPSKAPPPVPAE